MAKTRRLTDQVLILNCITEVRLELQQAHDRDADFRELSDIMTRLTGLYACIDTARIVPILKQADKRGERV